MKEILAVVVTYNRKELLIECINALLNQTYKEYNILVINNASTDGTEILLKEYKEKNDNFNYITLDNNIGGAGGFNFGIKESIVRNYDYVWLMDDDTIPNENALESLIKKKEFLQDNFSYLASVVKWVDGNWCNMNVPLEKRVFGDKFDYIEKGLLEIKSSSFVSCFINLKTSKQYGLPIKEFFIYSDDVEYTNRISKHNPAYLDLNSCVIHKMKQNATDERFSTTDKIRIKRSRYSYRNKFYMAKQKGLLAIMKYILRYFYHFAKYIIKSPKYRLMKILYMTQGMIEGIFFNPKIEYVFENINNMEDKK